MNKYFNNYVFILLFVFQYFILQVISSNTSKDVLRDELLYSDFTDVEEYCSERDLFEQLNDVALKKQKHHHGHHHANITHHIESIDEYQLIDKYLDNNQYNISSKQKEFAKEIMNELKDTLLNLALDSKCYSAFVKLFNGFSSGDKWAVRCETMYFVFWANTMFIVKQTLIHNYEMIMICVLESRVQAMSSTIGLLPSIA